MPSEQPDAVGNLKFREARLPELDGIRGCAILMVLLWHYVACQISATEGSAYAVKSALSWAWSGVDLFFVLSGFLIAGILMDNRDASNYFRVFYFRRICRIFPLYYLLLGVYFVLTDLGFNRSVSFDWVAVDLLPLWSYATFTQNILMGNRGNFGGYGLAVTWSLAVEEQFYCVIPLIIWFLPRRSFVYAALLGIVAAPVLRLTYGGFRGFVWTPWRADSLLTGALLAAAVRDSSTLRLLSSHVRTLKAVFVVLVAGFVVLTLHPSKFNAARHTWLAAIYGLFLLLPLLDRECLMARILRNRALVWLGVTSYGIYMFHQTVSGLVHGFFSTSGPESYATGIGVPTIETVRGRWLTLLSLGLTLALAAASYRYFERPILGFGHRFKYRKPIGQTPSQPDSNSPAA